MEFRLLGPVEVAPRRPRHRARRREAARAACATPAACERSRVARPDRIDALWGDRPPGPAGHSLDVQISRLRKAFEPDEVLLTRPGGYLLRGRTRADRRAPLRAAARGRDAGSMRRVSRPRRGRRSSPRLGLWRGAALADLSYETFTQTEITRLDELRLIAVEECVDADARARTARRARPRTRVVDGEASIARADTGSADARALTVPAVTRRRCACTATRENNSSTSSASSRASRCWRTRAGDPPPGSGARPAAVGRSRRDAAALWPARVLSSSRASLLPRSCWATQRWDGERAGARCIRVERVPRRRQRRDCSARSPFRGIGAGGSTVTRCGARQWTAR